MTEATGEALVRLIDAYCPVHGVMTRTGTRGFGGLEYGDPVLGHAIPLIELREGLQCGWCEQQGDYNQLLIATEPLEPGGDRP